MIDFFCQQGEDEKGFNYCKFLINNKQNFVSSNLACYHPHN